MIQCISSSRDGNTGFLKINDKNTKSQCYYNYYFPSKSLSEYN